jgi:hypothetical protein
MLVKMESFSNNPMWEIPLKWGPFSNASIVFYLQDNDVT